MQQQPNFFENLIALRNHYQVLLEDYEHSKAHAREQLTHVNALLVEQLVLNQQLVDSLIALRDRYQGLNDECEQKAFHVREQLTHVNALLVNQLMVQHKQQPVSIQASTVNQNLAPALTGITNIKSEELLKLDKLGKANEQDEPDEADGPNELDEQNQSTFSRRATTPPAALTSSISLSQSEIVRQSSPERIEAFSVDSSSRLRQLSDTMTPMLPRYGNLTKLQAVEKLLSENSGTILHVDYIIRGLYGELDSNAISKEKPRIYDTLRRGTEKKLWYKVPDQASCYTIDLKLVAPELVPKETAQQSKVHSVRTQFKGKFDNNLLPLYQGLNLVDAISMIIRENSGKILNIDKVARTLYGDLSGQPLTKAKERVGKALWSGAIQKRWQRLPGQLGCYTLDLKLLD